MRQKEAVVHFWTQGKEQGLEGDALFSFVEANVATGLFDGSIDHKNPAIRGDEKKAKGYAASLTSNHFKKAKEINGNVSYVPETRRGPIVKDQRLKDLTVSLKSLEANQADMTLITTVQAAIDSRKAELAATKAVSKVPSLEDTMAKLAELGIQG